MQVLIGVARVLNQVMVLGNTRVSNRPVIVFGREYRCTVRPVNIINNDDIDGPNSTPVFPAKNYYWPVGNSRIAQNPKLVENPGYAN